MRRSGSRRAGVSFEHMHLRLCVVIVLCLLQTLAFASETEPSSSSKPWHELVNPQRASVGEGDQWQATGDGTQVFFTSVKNQASTIERLRIEGQGLLQRYRPERRPFDVRYDTQEPDWNASLSSLAYVSYETNARGEICLESLDSKASSPATGEERQCFDHPGRVAQPLWGPGNQIFFLSSALPWESGGQDAIWVLDPQSRISRKILEYGKIASFAVHHDTGDVVAVGWESRATEASRSVARPHFLYGQAASRRAYVEADAGYKPFVRFGIEYPGFPATPRFDRVADELLFGYFVDDSNGDGRLDGDDRSVVLALPFGSLRRALHSDDPNTSARRRSRLIPRTLTSSSWNCLYPNRVGDSILMACAPLSERIVNGEPKLSLYALPADGMVPSSWSLEELKAAREQARDARSQILLTGALSHRLAREGQTIESVQWAELALLHAESGEYGAAAEVFHLWRKQASGRSSLSPDASLMGLILSGLKELRDGRDFMIKGAGISLADRLVLAKSLASHPLGKEVADRVIAQLRTLETGTPFVFPEGWSSLASWSPKKETDFYDRSFVYLGSHLVKRALAEGVMPQAKASRDLASLAEAIYGTDPKLALALAVDSLEFASVSKQQVVPRFKNTELQKLNQTQDQLVALLAGSSGQGNAVDKETRARFGKLSQDLLAIYKEQGLRPFGAHCALVGSALLRSGQSLLLGFHAANWLSTVPLRSFEYGEILAFYRGVYFERAYGEWNAGNPRAAADIFYTAMRLTRDEEAHLGFVISALDAGQSSEDLLRRYESTEEALGQDFSGRPLLNALLLLSEYFEKVEKTPSADPAVAKNLLKKTLVALDDPQASVPLARNHLKAVVYQELYRGSLLAGEPDVEAFRGGLRHASLALQDSASSGRVRGALLFNRGRLELLGGNFGAAAGDLERALELLPAGAQDRAMLTLLASRAAGRAGRPDQAVALLRAWESDRPKGTVATEGGAEERSSREEGPLRWSKSRPFPASLLESEKAFHLAEAGQMTESCAVYGPLAPDYLDRAEKSVDPDVVFAALGRAEHGAWSCSRSSDEAHRDQAKAWFTRIRDRAVRLPASVLRRKAKRLDFLDSHPSQLVARASGFLALLSESDGEKRLHLEKRLAALGELKASGGSLALSEREISLMELRTCVQLLGIDAKKAQETPKGPSCLQEPLKQLVSEEGLRPSRDEMEVLRASFLLLVFRPTSWTSEEAAALRAQLLSLLENALGRPESLSAASFGEPLKLQYLQTHMLGSLVRNLQEGPAAGQERIPAGGEEWVDDTLTRLGLATETSGGSLGRLEDRSFLRAPTRESLVLWGDSLIQSLRTVSQ